MPRLLMLLAPMALLSLASPARASSQPYTSWSLAEVWPLEAEPLPLEGMIVLRGTPLGFLEDAELAFGEVVDVAVLEGDEVIEGQVSSVGVDEVVWQASGPLAADTTYLIIVTVSLDDGSDPTEIRLERTAAAVDGEASLVMSSATAEAWTRGVETCVQERDDSGGCDWCEEFGITSTEERLRLVVSIARPETPAAGGYRALVRVGATEAEAAAGSAWAARRFWGAQQLEVTTPVALRADWPGEVVCFAVGLEAPGGASQWAAPSCLPIEDHTETIPLYSANGDANEDDGAGGCAAAPGRSTGGAWGLLLIVGACRRRLR